MLFMNIKSTKRQTSEQVTFFCLLVCVFVLFMLFMLVKCSCKKNLKSPDNLNYHTNFVILNKTDIRVIGARKKSLFFLKLISAKIFLMLPEGFTLGNTLEDISFLTGIYQD